MRPFRAGGAYDPARDVRDWDRLRFPDLTREAPNGILWPIVGARRSGKTWALRALARRLPDGAALYRDLRSESLDVPPDARRGAGRRFLLLDEPARLLGFDAAELAARLLALAGRGMTIVLAMTPGEWTTLLDAGARVDPKDVLVLGPLDATEAGRLARTDVARALLPQLPPDWTRSPFLLELLLETAEAAPALVSDIPALLAAAVDASEDPAHRYFEAVFRSGLSEAQRDVLRAAVTGGQALGREARVLTDCGLLAPCAGGLRLADPVLAHHLPPPLVLHHVSDIHVGPKAALRVDAKEGGLLGERLAAAAGQRPVRIDYAAHVEALRGGPSAPHLLVVSGDLTEKGLPDEYDGAREWLGEVEGALADHPALSGRPNRVLLVGGNHDVDWSKATAGADPAARHTTFAATFDAYPRPRLEADPARRGLAVVDFPEADLQVLLLGSAELGGEPDAGKDRTALLALLDRLRDTATGADADAATKALSEVTHLDPGLVHDEELRRVRRHPWTAKVRIAVLHHPVSPLPATEVARFAGLLNAGEVKDALLAAGVCLVLHGHIHAGWFACERWQGRHGDKCLRIAAAPSLGSLEVLEHNGFNEIELRREGHEHRLVVRRVVREGGTWTRKAQLGPFAPGACEVEGRCAGAS